MKYVATKVLTYNGKYGALHLSAGGESSEKAVELQGRHPFDFYPYDLHSTIHVI
jgi:hypothetical protein